jgi:hypothetical protein
MLRAAMLFRSQKPVEKFLLRYLFFCVFLCFSVDSGAIKDVLYAAGFAAGQDQGRFSTCPKRTTESSI